MTSPDTNESTATRFAIPIWAWVAAILVLLFFALTLWQARKLQGQLAEMQLQMRAEQSRKNQLETHKQELDQIRTLLASPETRALQLKPLPPETLPFKIFWNEEIGLLVTARDMPVIPTGRVLQLWIIPKQGSPINAGTLQPDTSGTVLKLMRPGTPISMKDAETLTMTVESMGGSPQPTSMPTWVGRIH